MKADSLMEAGGVPVTHCRRCDRPVHDVPADKICPHCGGAVFRTAEEIARLRASFDEEDAAEERATVAYCIDPVGGLAAWLADNGCGAYGLVEVYRALPVSYRTREHVALGKPCYVRSRDVAVAEGCQDQVILVDAP